jgi:acyl-coenzyme A synthetase/AMP-(fatty) acid ligase
LHRIPEVQDAVVVAVQTGTWEGLSICCAFVPAKDSGLTPGVLRKKLAEVLPTYMLPESWSVLEKIPLNTNGKADRPLIKLFFSREREGTSVQAAGAVASAPAMPPASRPAVMES